MRGILLKNGIRMPLLGYGVLQMNEHEKCRQCVREAAAAGYRMFDTAASYGNEEAVGQALREAVEAGEVKREELFLITKLSIEDTEEAKAYRAFEESLEKLQTEYLDLYLIGQPYNDYYGAWRALEKLYNEGRIRAIGVSNFSPERLTDLCLNSRIPPMVDQIETHPFYHQREALRTMGELGVQPQAWAPLCEGLKTFFPIKHWAGLEESMGKQRPRQLSDGI